MSADTGYETLKTVLDTYHPQGWAIEFGVYKGQSLSIIASRGIPVIGLDSFDGLPEDWRPGFEKGKFATSSPLLIPENAMVVPGLFTDTIPLLKQRGLPDFFGLVHIDCDLYSSTVTALQGVLDNIGPGTFIVFDEYHGYEGCEEHEMQAWDEFCRFYGVKWTMVNEGSEEAAFRIESIA